MTTEEVRAILGMAQPPVSLEKPVGQENESELVDFVADESVEDMDEAISRALVGEAVEHVLAQLPERKRTVSSASASRLIQVADVITEPEYLQDEPGDDDESLFVPFALGR